MLKPLHFATGLAATALISGFFVATVAVELLGTTTQVARLKHGVVMPGLLLLLPLIVITGASGFALARGHRAGLVGVKRRRMPLVALTGLLVLVPCALLLDHWAAAGRFDAAFFTVQLIELLAGASNVRLMAMNLRDGLRLSGRFARSNR